MLIKLLVKVLEVAGIKFNLTSGFREVFAKQKFGWSLQGGISKSLLYVFSARKKAEGSVKFSR
jgi:hypothetical protein